MGDGDRIVAAGGDFLAIGAWDALVMLALLVGAIALVAVGVRLALWWRGGTTDQPRADRPPRHPDRT
ncbi:hypothetical protein CFK38_07160 [Brachybacterium vulturis]|uniref:Uncharacterized protein n=2 Tax=Brachybacterium vulturis TaxID=2017484 RepID=A0A291GMM8_9MICO|nr:hypothetical protein CFK38_07160 [Brachybacterium vulturis]